jgi:GTP-binding protein HflX
VHIVDISHSDFEDQIKVVNQTLAEIKASYKPTILLFNKIDAFNYVKKDPFDLTPVTRENLSLEDLKKTWMATTHYPTLFMSATQKINLEEFKQVLYEEVKKIHVRIYPYNNFLFEK